MLTLIILIIMSLITAVIHSHVSLIASQPAFLHVECTSTDCLGTAACVPRWLIRNLPVAGVLTLDNIAPAFMLRLCPVLTASSNWDKVQDKENGERSSKETKNGALNDSFWKV